MQFSPNSGDINVNFSILLAYLTPVFLLEIYKNVDIIFDKLDIIFEN